MKDKIKFIQRSLLAVFIVSLLSLFCLPAYAQNDIAAEKDKLLPPAEEKFEEVDALASPFRVGYCPDDATLMPGCRSKRETRSPLASIYNEDGSLWYTYSNQYIDANFYKKNKTMDFLPFASWGDFESNAILRMVGESEHWYKVEVNEKTRATKFILKNDSNWEKTTWNFWLAKIQWFAAHEDSKMEIYDKPNGKVIGKAADSNIRYFKYLDKTDGDWAYVEYTKDKVNYRIWIRWREGRNLLVRDFGNFFIVNEIKSDANN